MYSETTENITVQVQPTYLPDRSDPSDNQYVWAYHIRIENCGSETVQLLNRHWRITDGFGRTQDVHGPGVVGEQPVLQPGEAFEYTSGTPLPTPNGIMVGSYEMARDNGERFWIAVPAFSLDCPDQPRMIN